MSETQRPALHTRKNTEASEHDPDDGELRFGAAAVEKTVDKELAGVRKGQSSIQSIRDMLTRLEPAQRLVPVNYRSKQVH